MSIFDQNAILPRSAHVTICMACCTSHLTICMACCTSNTIISQDTAQSTSSSADAANSCSLGQTHLVLYRNCKVLCALLELPDSHIIRHVTVTGNTDGLQTCHKRTATAQLLPSADHSGANCDCPGPALILQQHPQRDPALLGMLPGNLNLLKTCYPGTFRQLLRHLYLAGPTDPAASAYATNLHNLHLKEGSSSGSRYVARQTVPIPMCCSTSPCCSSCLALEIQKQLMGLKALGGREIRTKMMLDILCYAPTLDSELWTGRSGCMNLTPASSVLSDAMKLL